VHYTWEFTSEHPIRSTVPLWLVYGLPMLILKSLWAGLSNDPLPPSVIYWTLRILMFTLSFVLEDWAVQELVNSNRQKRIAMILTASSYVTWTYQTHTFSNSIETLLVLWSLVLITRIIGSKVGRRHISNQLTIAGPHQLYNLLIVGFSPRHGSFQPNHLSGILFGSWL
jgi:phosphatidylinositol glycan class Z